MTTLTSLKHETALITKALAVNEKQTVKVNLWRPNNQPQYLIITKR
jgi:hypothetical protein